MLVLSGMLLACYFALDSYYYRREDPARRTTAGPREPLKLEGAHNILFLAGIVGAVLMSGLANWGEVSVLGVHRGVQDWVRDGLLIAMGVLSLVTTRVRIRDDNQFTWAPIVEVALLFIGIFITMLPCLLILKAGPNGAMAFLIRAIREGRSTPACRRRSAWCTSWASCPTTSRRSRPARSSSGRSATSATPPTS